MLQDNLPVAVGSAATRSTGLAAYGFDLIPAEEIIITDTETVGDDDIQRFRLIFEGQEVGGLNYHPPKRRNEGRWQIHLGLLDHRSCDIYGYGATPAGALRDALTGGLTALREECRLLVALANRIKKNTKNLVVKER